MKKLWIVLAALVLLTPVGIWWFSPEQVIVRRTKHLMEVVSMSGGTGGTLRQAKVFSMNAMLSPEVELDIPATAEANGTFDKQEMEAAFSWICQNAKSSSFRVTDFKKVEITGDRAKVRVNVAGYMEFPVYRPADGTFDVTIDWIKGGDGWRFEKIVWKDL